MKKINSKNFNNTAFLGSIFGSLFYPVQKANRVKTQSYVPINKRRV